MKTKIIKKDDKICKLDEKLNNIIEQNNKTQRMNEKLLEDNDNTIYFDRKYDKTNYGILEESYGKQVLTMSPDELKEYIAKDLMINKKMI